MTPKEKFFKLYQGGFIDKLRLLQLTQQLGPMTIQFCPWCSENIPFKNRNDNKNTYFCDKCNVTFSIIEHE